VREAVKLLTPWILYRLIWTPVLRFTFAHLLAGRGHVFLSLIAFTGGCVAILVSLAINGQLDHVFSALVVLVLQTLLMPSLHVHVVERTLTL